MCIEVSNGIKKECYSKIDKYCLRDAVNRTVLVDLQSDQVVAFSDSPIICGLPNWARCIRRGVDLLSDIQRNYA